MARARWGPQASEPIPLARASCAPHGRCMNPVEAEAGNGQAVAAARTRAHARAYRHSGRVRAMRRLIPVAAGGSVALLLAYLFNPFAATLPGVSVGPVTLAGSKVRMENPRLAGFRQGTRG